MESPPLEIELKLLVAPGDVHRLRRSPVIRESAVGPTRTRPLLSIYFDTPDLDLWKAGIVLRVRREGSAWIQTAKTQAATRAGLFTRGEWECRLPGPRPDPDAIPEAGVRAQVARAVHAQSLHAVVETDIRRSRRILHRGGAEIAFDLDVGEVRAGGATLPVCELELELLQGPPAALFDLAVELQRSVDLRPGSVGKAEAGFHRLTGEAPTPQRAHRPEIGAGSTLDDALAAILGAGVDQISANEEPARLGIDPEGVHQFRIGVRRVRSALQLLKRYLPEHHAEPLRRELRWLAGETGPARDLDVFLEEFAEPVLSRFPGDPDLKRLRDAARDLRTVAYGRVAEALDGSRYPALMLRLGAFVAARRWREQPLSPESALLFSPARETAARVLARRQRTVRRLGRHIEDRSIDELHELRIQLKKLRYVGEFFAGLYPDGKPGRWLRRLSRLQDRLGRLNDQRVAEEVLADVLEHLGAECRPEHHRAAGFIAGWSGHRAQLADAEARKRTRSFIEARPFWTR